MRNIEVKLGKDGCKRKPFDISLYPIEKDFYIGENHGRNQLKWRTRAEIQDICQDLTSFAWNVAIMNRQTMVVGEANQISQK